MKWGAYIFLAIGVFILSFKYNERFLEWLRFQSIGTRDYIVERLGMMFIEVSPHNVLLSMAAISFIPSMILFLAFLPNYEAGLVFAIIWAIIGWKLPKPIVNLVYQRRVNVLVGQLVDGLALMSNGMRSGLSVVQSMGLVAQQMSNPIQQEFNLILNQNKLGVSVEEAFVNFSKRVKSDDVEMFVTAVNILKETGGNLAETFDIIVTTIRERIRVEKKIEAMTAQQFLQGVSLLCVAPVMAVTFYTSDPKMMEPMLNQPIGILLTVVVIVLEIVAFFVIMKIVKIDV